MPGRDQPDEDAHGDRSRKQTRVRALDVLDKQLRARARAGTLRAISHEQLLVNLLALCIFPFASRPILAAMLGLEDAAFRRFIAQRRKELPTFFLRALQP